MRINNLRDLLADQIMDCYSFENQVERALQQWSEQTEHDELKQMFKNQLSNVRTNRNHLEQISRSLGISATGKKCRGTEGIIQEGNEFLNDVTDEDAKDAGLIAVAQRLEHYAMAAYGCARTYALHLDEGDAADRLQQILDQKGRIDEQMTQLAESRLNLEAVS